MSGDKKVIDSIGHGRMLEKERRIGMTVMAGSKGTKGEDRKERTESESVTCYVTNYLWFNIIIMLSSSIR